MHIILGGYGVGGHGAGGYGGGTGGGTAAVVKLVNLICIINNRLTWGFLGGQLVHVTHAPARKDK